MMMNKVLTDERLDWLVEKGLEITIWSLLGIFEVLVYISKFFRRGIEETFWVPRAIPALMKMVDFLRPRFPRLKRAFDYIQNPNPSMLLELFPVFLSICVVGIIGALVPPWTIWIVLGVLFVSTVAELVQELEKNYDPTHNGLTNFYLSTTALTVWGAVSGIVEFISWLVT